MTDQQTDLPAPPRLDTRLDTRIPADVDERLRLTALVQRRSLGRVLAEALEAHLQSRAQLAAQLQTAGGTPDD